MGISAIGNNIFNFEMVYINEGLLDKEAVKRRLERFNENSEILNNGTYHRIRNLCRDKNVECWEVVSDDKTKATIAFGGINDGNKDGIKRIKLKGLNEDAVYKIQETGKVFLGGSLMHIGVSIDKLFNYHTGDILHLQVV